MIEVTYGGQRIEPDVFSIDGPGRGWVAAFAPPDTDIYPGDEVTVTIPDVRSWRDRLADWLLGRRADPRVLKYVVTDVRYRARGGNAEIRAQDIASWTADHTIGGLDGTRAAD